MRPSLLALLSVAAALGACAVASPPAAEDALAGPEWRLEDLNGRGVIDDSRVSVRFGPDGRAGGLGGCNRWFGAWRRDGDALSFSDLGSTRMACAEALMRQETAFLSALQETDSHAFASDGALVLTTRDGRRLVFRPATD